jgi:hypothetical protein
MSTKKTGTAKYDWIRIKQEYFDSDIEEVEHFLRSFLDIKTKIISGDKKQKIKGWRKEKSRYRQRIIDAENEAKNKNIDVQKQVQTLLTALANIEKKVAILLGDGSAFSIDDLPKIKIGYEILRLATGKSTTNQGGDASNPSIIRIEKSITYNEHE